jgi:hypothetical protein
MKISVLGGMLVSAILVTPLTAIENAAWLAKLEGLYMSQDSPTPFGRIGFAMDMIKQADGSVHGRVQSDNDTYFDFKFWLNQKGDILFRETGALPGGFVQSYELQLVKADGDTLTFETREKPGLLSAQVTVDGSRFRVKAMVRGKPHVDLDMALVRDERVIAKFRADQARAKDLPSGTALKQFFAAAAAKKIHSNLPKTEQARLHVAEAQKLGEQIAKADPADAPRLAFLMRGHLETAGALDPSFDQAHFALAMWYLQPPELAAASKAKVNELLAELDRLNSPLAEVLRQKMAGRN